MCTGVEIAIGWTEVKVVQDIIIRAIVPGVLAVAAWFLRGWGRRAVVATTAAVREKVQGIRSARVARARVSQQELAIREAAEADKVIVRSATGSNPTTVTVEGARYDVGFYYTDLRRYKRDVSSGRIPHLRAFCCGRPPRAGQRLAIPTGKT